MNEKKLLAAETRFMLMYPGGFEHPEMKAIGKKHKVEKMTELAHLSFSLESFENPNQVAEQLIKLVSQSSLISVFEKPKFKEAVMSMGAEELVELSESIKSLLHKDEADGFSRLGYCLSRYKMAKWPLMTVIQSYYRPDFDLLLKPTTVKGIIKTFELTEFIYSPTPTYEFYEQYRAEIHRMKAMVDPSLSPSVTAFCGFLMMNFDL
jgi:hypothetical protein